MRHSDITQAGLEDPTPAFRVVSKSIHRRLFSCEGSLPSGALVRWDRYGRFSACLEIYAIIARNAINLELCSKPGICDSTYQITCDRDQITAREERRGFRFRKVHPETMGVK